ncbi:unnamed protein product [Allacma fusca]|uniref:CUB domain-containing protein n=1 Tax=Allacma fusca TaxID=39272 RepID=A0A8J2JJT8_9HEXA|nr:unnamed protein product [Allacma fusca]
MFNPSKFNVLSLLCHVLFWNNFVTVTGTGTSSVSQTCSGICTRDQNECKNQGGKVFGSCENGYTCCDTTWKDTSSCGAIKASKNPVYFVSPDYPAFIGRDIVCTFGLTLAEDVVAVRIDFLDVEMDGLSYFPRGASCESDMFILKGFKTWTPPSLCGNLTGYSSKYL